MPPIEVHPAPQSQHILHSPLLRGDCGGRVRAGAKLLVGGDCRGHSLLQVEEAEGGCTFFIFRLLDDGSGNDSFFLCGRTYHTPPAGEKVDVGEKFSQFKRHWSYQRLQLPLDTHLNDGQQVLTATPALEKLEDFDDPSDQLLCQLDVPFVSGGVVGVLGDEGDEVVVLLVGAVGQEGGEVL
jgi:hypothetical protein